MPKTKTNRSAAKRFRLTGTGKIRFHHASKSHLLTKKSRARKRRLRKAAILTGGDARHVRSLVPFLKKKK